jgi:centromeric protein E
MTSILCTITPAPMHREETVSTLKFGQLCKTIKNTVKSNEVVDDRMLIKQYKGTIQELRLQVNKLEGAVLITLHTYRTKTFTTLL